jgi:hypothetical protein
MFTPMGKNPKPLPPEWQEIVESMEPLGMLADLLGWPRQWIVCPHCGEHSWRIPPHLFEPCPLVVDAAQTAGLKMDAERNQAIRSAQTLENQWRAFEEYIRKMAGEEE